MIRGDGILLNLREELQKFKAINLQGLEESIANLSDDVKNSIALYNKAIESIGKGSEDIAVIELKKAVSINPNFHEAINLLGLCYAYTGEKEKASRMFERVIELERNGIQAYVYRKQMGGTIPEPLQAIISGEDIPIAEKVKKAPTRKALDVREVKAPPGKRNILKYGVGFLAGVLLMVIVNSSNVFPRKVNMPSTENGITALEEEKAALQRELNSVNSKYSELEIKYNSIARQLEESNAAADQLPVLRKLIEAGILEADERYEEAADLLLELDENTLGDPEKTWFESLRETVLSRAAQIAYEEGKNLCQNVQNYEEGLEKLSKVLLYKEDFQQMEALLYYTGKCYQGVGKYDEAMECYNRILNEYPGGYYSGYVRLRIDEVNRARESEQIEQSE